MRTNDFDAQNVFNMTEEQYDAALEYALNRFEEIETKNPEDYDLGHLEGEDDYADCPDMFNYPDFS